LDSPCTIGFDFTSDETPLHARVARRLAKERGYAVAGLTLGRRWKDSWVDLPTRAMEPLRELKRPLRESLERIEREYGDVFPAGFPIADRFMWRRRAEEQQQMLVNTFEAVEGFVLGFKPDIYISTGIAFMFTLVTHAVCRRYGVPHASLVSTRGSQPRFVHRLGTQDHWGLVSRCFRELRRLDEGELSRLWAEEESEIETGRPLFYMTLKRQSLSMEPVFIAEFFRRLRQYYLEGWGFERGDYYTRHPLWYVKRDMTKLLRARWVRWSRGRVFDQPRRGERYYLFPLHLHPEASTLIYAPWYVDQAAAVRNIAQCIPADSRLYVKEHISATGRNPFGFYRGIREIPNVRLLGPWEDTPGLIRDSEGVIVLTSTMGWESLNLGKPTFVLGDVFYNEVAPQMRASSYPELREKVRQVRLGRVARVSEHDLRAFKLAIQRGSFPGMYDVCKMDTLGAVLDDRTVAMIYDGVCRVIDLECVGKGEIHINPAIPWMSDSLSSASARH
jgi:hypothetical protein